MKKYFIIVSCISILFACNENTKHDTTHKHHDNHPHDDHHHEKNTKYHKEWKTYDVQAIDFTQIIKTTGKILPAIGDEHTIIAKSSGTVQFTNSKNVGSAIRAYEKIATIESSGLIENNFSVQYQKTQSNFEQAQANYNRAKQLIADRIISEKEFLQLKAKYQKAKVTFENLNKSNAQQIKSKKAGYIKQYFVQPGQYVNAGDAIASIVQNKNLTLQVNLPERYFNVLNHVQSANFKTAFSSEIYETTRILSKAKTLPKGAFQLPLLFEVKNEGNLVAGSMTTVYLKTKAMPKTIAIPKTSLLEEIGNYFVYVKIAPDDFEKRRVKLGASNGKMIAIVSGLEVGEVIVSEDVYTLKLESMSNQLPEHGHHH